MKLRHIGKKADLSLSINAIVILILAITMLGLGLAFLRGTFKRTTAQFEEVSGTVREQIVDEIKAKGEKLFIRGQPQIDVSKGETKDVFFGIKNVESAKKYFTIITNCTTSIGGLPGADASRYVTFKTIHRIGIAQGEFSVLPLQIVVDPNANLDTYSCFMKICSNTVDDLVGACPTLAAVTTTTGPGVTPVRTVAPYAQNDFFVKVAAP